MTRVELVNRFQIAKDVLGEQCEFSVPAILSLQQSYAEAIVEVLEEAAETKRRNYRDTLRESKELTAERCCFFEGDTYTVIQDLGKNWIIYASTDEVCHLVPKRRVEPLNDEVFFIGDIVKATFPGNKGFIGVVCGYESETNRVLCKSLDASKTDRTRYAYRVGEIDIVK